MSPIQSMIALLFALGSAGALAQNVAAQQPPTGKPVDDSASYGPVLNPQQPTPATTQQPTPASTQAAGEARPQAQEERAGQPPVTGKQNEVDPSARPAPGTGQPAPAQTQPRAPAQPQTPLQPRTQQELQGKPEPRQQDKKQAQRRPGAVQRIEATPRIAAPAPAPAARTGVAAAPAPPGPQSSQVVSCVGGTCTDVNGTTYNAGGPGNVAISSSGRACTTNGTTVQCL
ncbi:hypothetical protein [Massilia sp.]|uniref:hypothetical protein n=1 Tax=Massilia sp. TaxID=1882437 RepID=UPI00391D35E7